MIRPPLTRELEAIVSMEHMEPFQLFRQWLEESLREQRERNDMLYDDAVMRQGQGRSQVLREILETIDGARGALKQNS